MAKLDFSSLKTADLRSVAPVDESAIPRAQQAQENETPVSASLPQTVEVPAPVAEVSVPVQAASSPHVPATPVVRTAPAAAHASKKISLTSLKTGGPSAVSHAPAAPAASIPAVSAPAVARTPTVAVSTVSKRSATTISLGTKPSVSITVPATESHVPAEEPVTDRAETVSELAAEGSAGEGRALIEGVDIIQAAKVIGTEGETIANEILTEALSDPEAAKKAAEEKAVAAVVIPETEKVFFPNLEMDDDFFDDPLFEGIVPPKPDKKPEVRQPIEMKKEEPVALSIAAETAPTESVEAVSEESAANPDEAAAARTSAVSEPAVREIVATEKTDAVIATAEPVSETPSQIPAEAYVETVAKDLSAERKGGLSKLFGERKMLVRAMAGFFAVAVLAVGAFSFVSPSIKTSGPEAMNTGSELPKYVPTGETKVVGEGVRVFTGRRPNAHKNKKASPVTSSGAVASSWAVSASGSSALPVPNPPSTVGSGSTGSGGQAAAPVLGGTGAADASAGAAVPEQAPPASPVPANLPANTDSAETPQPIEVPVPQADMPPAPMPN